MPRELSQSNPVSSRLLHNFALNLIFPPPSYPSLPITEHCRTVPVLSVQSYHNSYKTPRVTHHRAILYNYLARWLCSSTVSYKVIYRGRSAASNELPFLWTWYFERKREHTYETFFPNIFIIACYTYHCWNLVVFLNKGID